MYLLGFKYNSKPFTQIEVGLALNYLLKTPNDFQEIQIRKGSKDWMKLLPELNNKINLISYRQTKYSKRLLEIWKDDEELPFSEVLQKAKLLRQKRRTIIYYLNKLVKLKLIKKRVDDNGRTFYKHSKRSFSLCQNAT